MRSAYKEPARPVIAPDIINEISLTFLGLIPTDLTLSSFSLLAFNEIPNGEFKINLTSIIVIINHT